MKTTKLVPLEYGIQIDDETICNLGWKEGQDLFISEVDGAIQISAGESVELDLSEFSRHQLAAMIKDMHENNLTFNQWCGKVLEEICARN
jgi:hypothetical protein